MKIKYKLGASRDVDDFSDHHSPTKIKSIAKIRSLFVGWRFGIISGSVSVFVVLVLNLSFTLWTLSRGGIENQRGILHDGDCDEVRKLNIVAHLIINIFSTVILSSSNYCMQCLSAPTRAEIDKEHAQGRWLDVGIPSLRNLRRISRKRALLWILLGVSSLPLHLFYNSVIFASISTNNYAVVFANREFINATALEGVNRVNGPYSKSESATLKILSGLAWSGSLERMDSSHCIQAYAHDYLSDRSNLLLIGSDENSTSTPTVFLIESVNYTRIGCPGDMYAWICPNRAKTDCSDPCQAQLPQVLADVSLWKPAREPEVEIKFCLSQKTPERCKLQFSLQIVIVVIVVNTLKMILMLYVVFGLNETPLMTIGDAIASFLNKEDPTTKGCCLFTWFDIDHNKIRWQYREGESNGPPAKAWLPIKLHWASAVGETRWCACGIMLLLAVVACGFLLGFGISAIQGPKDIGTLWKLGLGAVNPRTLISSGEPSTLVSNVLIANIAQPILSFIYFTYNAAFTCMLAEREWNQFARKMGGLRISSIPCGSQRSSYFLQLPYRFAIPLMLLSGVLHWVVSQSIFLVAIETYDQGVRVNYQHDNSATYPDQLSYGYSPIAIMFVIILVLVMMLFGIGTGMKRYDPGIPIAGNCSVVLSAACHVEDEDSASSQMALKPLQWGVVRSGDEDEVGHCAFSTAKVPLPQKSALYAGKS